MAQKAPIHIKKSHEGLLADDLNIPEGKPIPLSAIKDKLKSAGPKVKKRLIFAENSRHWDHKK